MILLCLTPAQAKHIAETALDPELIEKCAAALRLEEIFVDVEDDPKTVIFKDMGDGLKVACVSYGNAQAAEIAEDRFWRLVQDGHTTAPVRRRRSKGELTPT